MYSSALSPCSRGGLVNSEHLSLVSEEVFEEVSPDGETAAAAPSTGAAEIIGTGVSGAPSGWSGVSSESGVSGVPGGSGKPGRPGEPDGIRTGTPGEDMWVETVIMLDI